MALQPGRPRRRTSPPRLPGSPSRSKLPSAATRPITSTATTSPIRTASQMPSSSSPAPSLRPTSSHCSPSFLTSPSYLSAYSCQMTTPAVANGWGGGREIEWLDKQQVGTMVYVAFRSELKLRHKQVAELAMVLEVSRLPFMRAYRDGPESLQVGFDERVMGRVWWSGGHRSWL